MTKPQFAYWDLRGLGQPTRFALAYMGVDYEHVVYHEEKEKDGGEATWKNRKELLGMEAPNLPYWIDDSIKLSESRAILKYVVRKYAPVLIPSDIRVLARVELMEGILADVLTYTAGAAYSGAIEGTESYYTFPFVVPQKLETLSKMLGDKKFLTGNDLCYLDFVMYETIHMMVSFKPDMVKPYRNFVNYMHNFEKLPAIEAYMKSEAFIKGPVFGRSSVAQI